MRCDVIGWGLRRWNTLRNNGSLVQDLEPYPLSVLLASKSDVSITNAFLFVRVWLRGSA